MEVYIAQWKATAIVSVHILDNAIRVLYIFHLYCIVLYCIVFIYIP